jgi:AcrR family transcriptional regulator
VPKKLVPRTQAERRAGSQRALLDAATQLIAARGSSGASFADIAELAGCSHGHPHYLFGNKTRMLQALIEDLANRLDLEVFAPALRGATGLAAVEKATRVFLLSLERPWSTTRALYVLLGESLGTAPELRPALNAYHVRLRATVEGWIAAGQAAGEIRREVDPAAYAAVLVGALRGIGFQVLADPGALDVRTVAEAMIDDVHRALRRATGGGPARRGRPILAR